MPYKEPPKEYQWKKGQSGNVSGRPKGKTLKEFAREYLEKLPDDEKVDFLASLPTEIVWKMAEGNPKTEDTLLVGELPIPLDPDVHKDSGLQENTQPNKTA